MQRSLRERGALVAEGRDLGSVVFPDAQVKIYLDADPGTRARRRHDELDGGDIDAVLRALRVHSPQDDAALHRGQSQAIEERLDDVEVVRVRHGPERRCLHRLVGQPRLRQPRRPQDATNDK